MNQELADRLTAMAEDDKRTLAALTERGELPAPDYHPEMRAVHERNAEALERILDEHGWPGVSLVGEAGGEAAWLIAQHAMSRLDLMERCASAVEEAASVGEAPGWQSAYLRDRLCVLNGEPQRYGTQFDVDEDGWPVPCPIADPAMVNLRRWALGLDSLEDRVEKLRERERERRARGAES